MNEFQQELFELQKCLETELSHNKEGKVTFQKISLSALKTLADKLGLKKTSISFEPSGIGTSGFATLRGMWSNNKGICVNIAQTVFSPHIMFRTIKHMNDYSAGVNHFIPNELINNEDNLLMKMKSLNI